MFQLALRQLALDRLRTVFVALAVGAAIAVILVLRGFEQGMYSQLSAMVLNRGAQLFVAQAGVTNFVAVRSSLPQLTRARVEAVPGVAVAHPLTGLPVIYGPSGNRVPIYVLVYDTLGGPAHIVAGGPIQNNRDVIIDVGLSRRYNLRPGDPLVVSDFEFRIAGITTENSALFMPFLFVSYDGMIDFYLESDVAPDISTFPLLSFLLLELAPGADPLATARAIEAQVPEADVLTPEQLARNDVMLGHELLGPIMGALIALGYIIGILVVGLIVYADIHSRRRNFGVMKALGFRLAHMVTTVSAQTLLLLAIAVPIGLGLALAIAESIEWVVPVYRVYVMEPTGLAATAAGVMVMALAGALLPLRLVTRTDPTVAFQEG